jgi:hypothetical protein
VEPWLDPDAPRHSITRKHFSEVYFARDGRGSKWNRTIGTRLLRNEQARNLPKPPLVEFAFLRIEDVSRADALGRVANEEHVIEVIHVRIVIRRKLEATGRLGDGRAVGADGGFERDSPWLSPQRRSLHGFLETCARCMLLMCHGM